MRFEYLDDLAAASESFADSAVDCGVLPRFEWKKSLGVAGELAASCSSDARERRFFCSIVVSFFKLASSPLFRFRPRDFGCGSSFVGFSSSVVSTVGAVIPLLFLLFRPRLALTGSFKHPN